MSGVGVQTLDFSVPVCNSFKAKLMNDQLCYEVDLNKLSDKNNIQRELKLGFNFLLDYNEDRQITFHQDIQYKKVNLSLAESVLEHDESQQAFVYKDSIGRKPK